MSVELSHRAALITLSPAYRTLSGADQLAFAKAVESADRFEDLDERFQQVLADGEKTGNVVPTLDELLKYHEKYLT